MREFRSLPWGFRALPSGRVLRSTRGSSNTAFLCHFINTSFKMKVFKISCHMTRLDSGLSVLLFAHERILLRPEAISDPEII